MREFVINKNDSGQRVDKFLVKALPDLPKNLMYKYIRLKRIKLNKKRCEISTRLNQGDVLSLYINDEFFPDNRNSRYDFLSVPTTFKIVYEDENILLVDKKSGIVVHEDESGSKDTLINRVLHYLYEKGDYNPVKENSFTPALCNRLDRNTGGIVIIAKNAESLRILNQKVKDRELQKLYLCVTYGIPVAKEKTLHGYLQRNEQTKIVKITDKKTKDNLTITTKYKVLKENKRDNLALVEVDLITGRTHQIRAHLSHEGYFILGDGKYGNGKINKKFGLKTQALYAYKLTFKFTTDGGILNYLNGKTFCVEDVWFKDKYFDVQI